MANKKCEFVFVGLSLSVWFCEVSVCFKVVFCNEIVVL